MTPIYRRVSLCSWRGTRCTATNTARCVNSRTACADLLRIQQRRHRKTWALVEELTNLSGGTRFDARAVGFWLRSNKGRIAGGYRLDAQMDRSTKVQKWRVVPST